MAVLEFLQPEGLARPAGYTQVVTVSPGKLIVISGQVALDANAQLVGAGDMHAQTQQVFENLRLALAAAGATFEQVIKLTILVVNYTPAHRAAIVEVRDQFIARGQPPASTLMGVQALARPEFLIEIEALAAAP
jgi:enamine deaminase RidA (YjgF/YER057c/UK114 family)